MSHELRTPLNAIIGYGEILQEDLADDEHEEQLTDAGRIVTAGRHLLGLINDVLDISKVEAGKMDLHIEVFDVAQLAHEVEGTRGNRVHRSAPRPRGGQPLMRSTPVVTGRRTLAKIDALLGW